MLNERRRGPVPAALHALAIGTLVAGLAACGSDDSSQTDGGATSDAPSASADAGTPAPKADSRKGGGEKRRGPDEGGDENAGGKQGGKSGKKAGKPRPSTGPTAAARSPRSYLLRAVAMPGPNAEWKWTSTRTRPEGQRTVGACQRTPLVTVGATRAVLRTYAGKDGADAAQVVASFADPKSAWRTGQAIKSWGRKCAESLKGANKTVKVTKLTSVPVANGRAWTWLAQYGSGEEHHFDGYAVNRRGAVLTLTRIGVLGQDYNYEAGQEPAAKAARRVARRLG